MTTKERLHHMLTYNGMFDRDADEVIKLTIPLLEALVPGYYITWDKPSTDYPDAQYDAWRISLYSTALQWIDANTPRAWYRDIFDLNSSLYTQQK